MKVIVNFRVKEDKDILSNCTGFLTDRAMDMGVKGQKFKKFVGSNVKL